MFASLVEYQRAVASKIPSNVPRMKPRTVSNNVKPICSASEPSASLIKNKCHTLVGELKIKGSIHFKREASSQKLKKAKKMTICTLSTNRFSPRTLRR